MLQLRTNSQKANQTPDQIVSQCSVVQTQLIVGKNVGIYNLRKKQYKHGTKMFLKLYFVVVHIFWFLWFQQLYIDKSLVEATEVLRVPRFNPGTGYTDSGTTSVATHGNFTIIGSKYQQNNGVASGSAYIFDQKLDHFTKLQANDGASSDYFGYSVAIFDNIAVVGSPYDDDSGINSGSVYIFEHNTELGTWDQSAKLTASDAGIYGKFGLSVGVSIYNNCHLVLVGTGAFIYGTHAVYYFSYNRSNGSWNERSIFTGSDVQNTGAGFGYSLAVKEKVALIASRTDDDLGINSGSVYVFRYDAGNDSWNEFEKLHASDGSAGDLFGSSVALYENTAIIGAFNSQHGKAYIFKYNENNESWVEVAKLTSSNPNSGDRFGYAVDIFGDLAVVAAPNSFNDLLGAAYVFNYSIVNNTWNEIAKIVGIDSLDADYFGVAVAIVDNFVIIGCYINCNWPTYVASIDDLVDPPLKMQINYNYKTSLNIIGIDNNTNYISDIVDECSSFEELDDSVSWTLQETGCYSIEFYDCDDSVVNDRTDFHGSYKIEVYGALAGIGGYYSNSETWVVCTNDIYNHVSFCIDPQFCVDNQQIWTNDESEILLTSYKAMVNSTIILYTVDETYLDCTGDQSCYSATFEVCYICGECIIA